MAFYDPFFDFTFGFLLNWDPLLAIAILSFIISLVIVIIYRLMTNQTEMKQLKEELKENQKKMKELKNDPEKLMATQKQAMASNMQYMKKSMKPTLVTFLPIILIFGWMNTHFAFEPLTPDQEFILTATFQKNITGNATITRIPEEIEIIGNKTQTITNGEAQFKLKGKQGEYLATINSNGKEVDKDIIITTERKYAPTIETYKNNEVFKTVQLNNQTLRVIWGISWFWAYLIFAIIFSMGLRKILKIY